MRRIEELGSAAAMLILLAAAAPTAQGQTASTPAAGDQNLGQAANDPTASLMAFQLHDFYSPTLHNDGGSLNVVQFRAAIPFELFGTNRIARLTLPAITNGPNSDAGLADSTLFDLVTFDRTWGRFGVGAVALLPTGGSERGTEQWAFGPAAGFVARPGDWLLGLFNQNLFRVAGGSDRPSVNVSTLQPIVNRSLGDGWSVGASELTFAYDWDQGEFTNLPLGIKVSKLTEHWARPCNSSFPTSATSTTRWSRPRTRLASRSSCCYRNRGCRQAGVRAESPNAARRRSQSVGR